MSPKKSSIKVIISGGGTGGHIYPALTIADALKESQIASSIHFVGAQGKMEMQKVPAYGYDIIGLPIVGFQRKQPWKNILLPFKLLSSLWQAHRLLKQLKPDVVIGTGGYASVPVLYMAAKHGIPTLIQEQNASPGLANRFLARSVSQVCVAYKSMEQYFPAKKVILTGNPVRKDLFNLASIRQKAYQHFNLSPSKPCLLVLGGSLGAHTLNTSILHSLSTLLQEDIQLIWVTGKAYFATLEKQLTDQQKASVRLYPFITSIHLAYAAADVVVARAGAGTIAELCIAQKPTIFVPSPNVTDDHQTKNILPLVQQGAALMVKDSQALKSLGDTILQLFRQPHEREQLARNLHQLAQPSATAMIVAAIEALTNKS